MRRFAAENSFILSLSKDEAPQGLMVRQAHHEVVR
jgi:hypothetical protein